MVTPTQMLVLEFADGSGNRYSFASESEESAGRLTYEPLTPEESSSGVYDGGEAGEFEITAEQNAALWQNVETLQNNTAIHVQDRNKGTGSFQLTRASGHAHFLIRMGPELSAFVLSLEELRGQPAPSQH